MTEMTGATLRQRLVGELVDTAGDRLDAWRNNARMSSKVDALPELLRRNGLLQVVLYYKSKATVEEGQKAGDDPLPVLRAIDGALSRIDRDLGILDEHRLATLDLPAYFFVSRLTLEAAVLMRRLVQATAVPSSGEGPAASTESEA